MGSSYLRDFVVCVLDTRLECEGLEKRRISINRKANIALPMQAAVIILRRLVG